MNARSRLVEHSIRLAQVQARLGTVEDMAVAVAVIADARDRLPRRLDNVVALETDAVGGSVAFSRAGGPLFSDRGWKLDVTHVAVSNAQTLTAFSTDPVSRDGAAVFRPGGKEPRVGSLQALLKDGRQKNIAAASNVCLHQAVMVGGEQARGVVWNRSSKSNLLTDFGSYEKHELGEIGAFALARGAEDRVVTLAWNESNKDGPSRTAKRLTSPTSECSLPL